MSNFNRMDMGFREYLIKQVGRPKGKAGKLIARVMNIGLHKRLAKWSLKFIIIKPNFIILDIGCGGGGNIKRMAEIATDGKVFGVDISEASVEVSEKINRKLIQKGRVEIKQATVSKLPFNKGMFDLVTGFQASLFWPDLVNDLKEIWRVLKPKGILLLSNEVYKCKNEKMRKKAENYSKLGNFSIHSPREYEELLITAGFSEIQVYEKDDDGWITVIAGKK